MLDTLAEIPALSLSRQQSDPEGFAQAFGQSFQRFGFAVVRDHGIPDALIERAWAMTKACVPAMKKQASGAIVLVSSTAGQRGEANYSNYAASKGGQISFTKALASELCPRIRVNCVAPGPVWTPIQPIAKPSDELETLGSNTPLGRAGQPAELAPAYVLLASDEGSYITGALIPVTGGMPML